MLVPSGRIAAAFVAGFVIAQAAPVELIPKPAVYRARGGSFVLTAKTPISAGPGAETAGSLLSGWLSADTGLSLELRHGSSRANGIVLELTGSERGSEAYSLVIEPDRVRIQAAGRSGLVYGCQTLRQLVSRGSGGRWEAACARIADRPRMAWRGLMLDCSRTFLTPGYLRRAIELLSFYKLNTLHLHLTDDQGWRLQIDRYPKLTSIGSQFAPRYAGERGGFYSKQDMRQLIRFGEERGVTLVPEIEMPGHATAALAAYPELSCSGGPFEVYPFFKGPNITKDVFCPGNEHTFEVLEDVLSEVAELFPAAYVHVGGDECPKDRWKTCPKCQARMRAEKLKDENALQAYFISRAARILERKGKKTIGWDEILEGGVPASAAVMFWRGTGEALQIAKAGHDIVLSPTRYCYFDYRQSKLPDERGEGSAPVTLEQVYSFDPAPASFGPDAARHVLGAQGNMWTHYARTEAEIDRQIFPRLAALAEVVWTPQGDRSWADFSRRIELNKMRLEKMGVKLGLNLQPRN